MESSEKTLIDNLLPNLVGKSIQIRHTTEYSPTQNEIFLHDQHDQSQCSPSNSSWQDGKQPTSTQQCED